MVRERIEAVDEADLVAVLLAQPTDDLGVLGAERTLEVGVLDDGQRGIRGPVGDVVSPAAAARDGSETAAPVKK